MLATDRDLEEPILISCPEDRGHQIRSLCQLEEPLQVRTTRELGLISEDTRPADVDITDLEVGRLEEVLRPLDEDLEELSRLAVRTLDRVPQPLTEGDRKSTRLNSSHVAISYAVFC